MFDPRLLLLLTLLVVFFPRPVRLKGKPVVFGFGWLLVLAIASIALSVVSALLTPKPKGAKPASASDLEDPSNDAGREMCVVFGEGVVKSGNFLWFGEKSVKHYEVDA